VPDLPVIFATRLSDAAKLAATGDRIAANQKLWEQGVQRSLEDHAGTKLYTFRTPFNPELKPSYAIVDDALLLSLRPEPVGAAIDLRKGKKEDEDRLKAGLQTKSAGSESRPSGRSGAQGYRRTHA
jgi:hypothetical protein